MEANFRPGEGDLIESFRVSWVAYVRPAFFCIFFGLISVGLYSAGSPGLSSQAVFALQALGCGFGVVTGLLLGYQVMMLRSIVLYTDQHGVWFYRGILPWNRGVSGVYWKDVQDALYVANFLSWAFNAYSVRITNRFTQSVELFLHNIRDGRKAVEHINSKRMEMLAQAER